MERQIAKAEYLIALTSNTVTEDIRNKYFEYVIENENNGFNIFESIVQTVLNSVSEQLMSEEEAYELICNEYNSTFLVKQLGNFNVYEPFIKKLISIYFMDMSKIDIMEDSYEFIEIADNLDARIAIGIYQLILMRLMNTSNLLTNVRFSKDLIYFINNTNVSNDERVFFETINLVLELTQR